MAVLDKATLHWREDGNSNGMPVVFANSLGTDLRLWDQIVPLMPSDLRLIRFDKRGHGLSSCPDSPYSMQDLTNDTAQLLDYLGVKSCFFVGLSIGGMIGQMLASDRSDLVGSLVLSNTAAKMGDARMWQDRVKLLKSGGLESISDQVLQRWFSEEFRKSPEMAGWHNMLIRTPLKGYIGCCQAIAGADLSDTTANLELPVLAIGGSADQACPSDVVAKTAAMVAGSQFRDVKGAGHLPCVEKPEIYAKLITDFIREHGNV